MSNLGGLLLPLLLLALVGFMFLSQRRRQRATQELQSSLSVGDEVCTTSGLFGIVTDVASDVVHLEIAPDTIVKFDRRAVALTVPSGTVASEPEELDDDEDEYDDVYEGEDDAPEDAVDDTAGTDDTDGADLPGDGTRAHEPGRRVDAPASPIDEK